MADWNQRFVDSAKFVAQWSKDDKGVGAQLYCPESHSTLLNGFNGFPRGVDDDVAERWEHPLKDVYIVHAETNAIFNAARHGLATKGLGLALDWFPCARCAGAIIQAGIVEVVCHKPDFTNKRWGGEFRVSSQMFSEAGIRVIFLPEDEPSSKVVAIAA